MKTQRAIAGLYEFSHDAAETIQSSSIYNKDLAPTNIKKRNWDTYSMASLWIGMSISTAAWMLPASLVAVGFSWWQAILTVALGNLVVLIPIILNAHAGTKYGVPFPVFARLSFGVRGANIAAIARAITGAGWFGIQCWLGSEALNTIISMASTTWAGWEYNSACAFLAFWALNVYIVYRGPETIRFMEAWGSPLLIVLCGALLVWSIEQVYAIGKGFDDILASMPSNISNEEFWPTFLGGLMANIAFWATLALNIPDFSRYAKNQKAQVRGQIIGLVPTMFGIAIIGTIVTGAVFVTTGKLVWDPVQVVADSGNSLMIILGAIGLVVATLTTNIAANAVATSNDISNLNPKKISFRHASLITGALGIIIMPWQLMSSAGAFVFGWLGTYGMVLGPLAGIFIADYYIYRKTKVDIIGLYNDEKNGRYYYTAGINLKAVAVWVISAAPALLGKVVPVLAPLTNIGWVLGFVLAIVLYPILMSSESKSLLSDEENQIITEFTEPVAEAANDPIDVLVAQKVAKPLEESMAVEDVKETIR